MVKTETNLAQILAEANPRCRSWREKLDFVRDLLVDETRQFATPDLVDLAVYFRFLATGEIPCAEDGRHFRPSHHARLSGQIQDRLARITTEENAFMIRKILPWLPSSGQTFTRAEPLIRIRDIAHRNDIPSELKTEIKHSLQNKLHRCAGPEDLATATALLQRITAPGASYSPAFVEQFTTFHAELKEFFNARSLEEQLAARTQKAAAPQAGLIRRFLAAKTGLEHHLSSQMHCLKLLSELRQALRAERAGDAGADVQETLLADIGLEDFAFVLLSQLLNTIDTLPGNAFPEPLLEAVVLTVSNLAWSGVSPAECGAITAELTACRDAGAPAEREALLRLKAAADRAKRLAEDFSDRILALFPPRAEVLGRALGVAEPAIRIFGEAEIRGHLVFQLSKLLALLLKRVRTRLGAPPWDALVTGRISGRLRLADSLGELGGLPEPRLIALIRKAAGDEEIPAHVAGIILAHPIPQLSHLGMRARQANVVCVVCDDPAKFRGLESLTGNWATLNAAPETIRLEVSAAGKSRPSERGIQSSPVVRAEPPRRQGWQRSQSIHSARIGRAEPPGGMNSTLPMASPVPVPVPEVRLKPEKLWLKLDQVILETGGAKAVGAGRLEQISRLDHAGFKTAPGLVIPFGVMEELLRSEPHLDQPYQQWLRQSMGLAKADLDAASDRLANWIQQLTVPEAITAAVIENLGPQTRLMVRSSANCEDLEGFASAGLYESVANVAPGAVAAAIKVVWASLWTRRAAGQRQQAGIAPEAAHMAVLIQRMIVPDYSFIMHTVNPINFNPQECLIELAVGLGETLASAACRGTPFRMVGDKKSGQIRVVAFANFSAGLWPAPAGGLIKKTVDYAQAALTSDAVFRQRLGSRLTRIAGWVEAAWQKSQDIEGVITGEDIYLVQSRSTARHALIRP